MAKRTSANTAHEAVSLRVLEEKIGELIRQREALLERLREQAAAMINNGLAPVNAQISAIVSLLPEDHEMRQPQTEGKVETNSG